MLFDTNSAFNTSNAGCKGPSSTVGLRDKVQFEAFYAYKQSLNLSFEAIRDLLEYFKKSPNKSISNSLDPFDPLAKF